MANPLEPTGFTGFGDGYYCPVAAWPQDTLCQTTGFAADAAKDPRKNPVIALNRMGYFGPGMWADAEGGLILTGCLDAPV
jgi:hypothetical protein